MINTKNIQSLIYLVIFHLFINQALAAEWVYYDTTSIGDMYYDKSRIKKVNNSITSVWTKNILSEKAKTKYFSILKSIDKAPDNPSRLSYYMELLEMDYANKKIKDISTIIYDEKGNVVYSSPKSDSDKWNVILPHSAGEKLYNIVSWEPVTPEETVAYAPEVTANNLPQFKSNRNEIKAIPKEAAPHLAAKAMNSSKSSNIEAYSNLESLNIADKKNRSAEGIRPLVTVREKARDGRFIAYDNLTVQDTSTKLMWAAKDNGDDINWQDAKNYCERYRGGGYADWRMPTRDELTGLYDANKTQRNKAAQNPLHLTKLINLTSCCPWTSETRDANAAFFDFNDGTVWWFLTSSPRINRALPVRSAQ